MPTYLELANFMNVPVQALRLARPSEYTCKVEGCANHAIVGNYRFCVYHNRKWYPLGNVTGNLLLGEEYLYTSSGKKLKYKCQCNLNDCSGIGYCDAGRFPFPNNFAHRQLWFDAMGWDIQADNYELDINLKPSNHCIAYWHFPPSRRFKLAGGQWTLIGRGSPYYDEKANKHYDILVPSNTIDNFIEEVNEESPSSPRKLSFMHTEVPYYLLPLSEPRAQVVTITTTEATSPPYTASNQPDTPVDIIHSVCKQADGETNDVDKVGRSVIAETLLQEGSPRLSKRKVMDYDEQSIHAQIVKKAKEESELLLNLKHAVVKAVL